MLKAYICKGSIIIARSPVSAKMIGHYGKLEKKEEKKCDPKKRVYTVWKERRESFIWKGQDLITDAETGSL